MSLQDRLIKELRLGNISAVPVRPVKVGNAPPWVLAKTLAEIKASKAHTPPLNHPWRQIFHVSAIKLPNQSSMTF